jgi:hypothetical protein
MSVDIFTKDIFENALSGMQVKASPKGLSQGEETYAVYVSKQVRIKIRSSVRANGCSAASGQDSIRLVIEVKADRKWEAIGKGPDAYTTRVKGWETRLATKLAQVQAKAKRITSVIQPGEIVRFSTTQANPGRPFSLVRDQTGRTRFGRWLDM